MPVPAILAAHMAFAHGDAVPLFDDVSFHLGPGFWGLVGENGAGKTTLLRLLAGELQPVEGSLRLLPEGARVLTCAQSVEAPGPDVELFAAAEGDGEAHRLRARLHLSVDSLARWTTLSPGERKRWQIGAALYADPDVLLLDEPTNHLDTAARRLLVAALRDFRGIGIVVSHDRALLDTLTRGTLRVRAGSVDSCPLPYSAAREVWESEAAARAAERTAARERVQSAGRRLAAAQKEEAGTTRNRSTSARMRNRNDSDARTIGAGNLAEWAQSGAGRRVATSKSDLARANAELTALGSAVKEPGRSLFVDWTPPARPLLISLALDELRAGPRVLARDVALTLHRDDRVHVRGENGSGKSTLLRALLSACTLPPERVLYLPQDLSAAERRALLAEVQHQPPEIRGRSLSLVAALGVEPERLLRSAEPSPGEARKLALALALAQEAWLLVLDEPENHLDLPSIERLEAALRDYPGALILVSHDDKLAARLTSRTWQIRDGQLRTQ